MFLVHMLRKSLPGILFLRIDSCNPDRSGQEETQVEPTLKEQAPKKQLLWW